MPTPTYHVEEKHEEEKEVPIKEEKPIVKKEVKPLKEKIYAKGQVQGTYLIGENEKGMYLIDQKAAQERINYEKYQEHFASSSLDIQPLTVPLIFEFTESEFMILEENKDKLEMIGINLESFSRNTFTLRSLPSWMTQIDEKHFIEDMCEKILNDEDLDLLELRDYAIIALASKFSVDRNTYLSTAEMQAIMDQLMRCDNPYVDASGKPTLIFYSDHELLKMFKRIR
jgi:DNA mismatch repair protein MutL